MENATSRLELTIQEKWKLWKAATADPTKFAERVFGIRTMWWGAEDIIRSVFTHRKTAVRAGHALSKDWTAGILAIQWLLTYWDDSKVMITGPTAEQVIGIVFKEISQRYNDLRVRFPEFSERALTHNRLFFSDRCFALGRVTKETNELVGHFAGFHSPNMLVIVTEANAIPKVIYNQISGLMTSRNSRLLEVGNPLVEYGEFYEHCTNPRLGYNVIHLSCFDSPNVTAKKTIIPGLVDWEYVESKRQEIGENYEDDPEWQARVLGEFPQQSTQAWIPLAKIRHAVGRTFRDDDGIVVGGLDVAREGQDETVHTVLRGRTMVKQDCFRKVLTPETVGWALGLIEKYGCRAVAIDLGYNPGAYDWLNEANTMGRTDLMGVNFGSKSPNPKFKDLGTYIWWCMREAFMHEEIGIEDDPILISQLASRKVMRTPKGEIKLESKRKATAKQSPDRGDALALAWYARMGQTSWAESLHDAGSVSDASRLEQAVDRITAATLVSIDDVTENAFFGDQDDVSAGGDNEASQLP